MRRSLNFWKDISFFCLTDKYVFGKTPFKSNLLSHPILFGLLFKHCCNCVKKSSICL